MFIPQNKEVLVYRKASMKYPEVRNVFSGEGVMQVGLEGYVGVCRWRQEEGEMFPTSL